MGNKPLNVTLVNALTNQPLANQRIDVKEILPNDEYKWRQRLTTDAQGKVAFDLDGLGSGRLYQLKSSPYQAGSVYSEILNTTGNFSFAVGNTPVTLIDARNGKAMAGFKLTSIEKTPDGKLHWKNSGTTDAQGVVNFDLSGVNSGRLYTILAKNTFAQNKYYFSPWISESGKVVFSISPGLTYRPDQKVPVISISSPSANALVSSNGFLLRGLVSDNDAIDRVEVNIGGSSGLATVSNNYWEYSVNAAMLGGLGNIPLSVTAYDVAQNKTQVGLSVNSIVDDEFPALDISSHLNGDKVSVKGFLISGNVSDNTGVRRLSADVNDSIYGKVKSDSKIEISASGRWTLVVEEVTLGATIDVVIKAVDSAGNLSSETVNLQVVSVIDDGVQLINRLTFGATPDLLDEVRKMGAQAFINQQLNPSTIDDTAFQDRIAFEVPDSHRDLIDYQLKYAIYSKRQLLEVMTWFWENHFNTDVNKTSHVGYELGENNLFRRHALGNFRDLLAVSSKSPGMMVYLDNITNRKEEPNENYARELMELHTLGVNGGYTNEDVAEVARVFTGWQERDHAFYFNESRHDYGEKLFVGNVIPAGLGVEGGDMILDILASHPATAKFICTKLLQVFVDDKPLPGSISGCAASFLSSNGNIKQVLQTIFASPEFNSPRQFHQKFKTPIEFLAGAERNLMAQHSPRNTYAEIQNLGMPLFHNPVPTGWAETGDKWINMNQLMTRIRFGTNLAFNEENYYNSNTYLNSVTEFFRSRGYETAQGVLGYLLMLTVDSDYTPFEWSVAYNKLTQDGRVPFELDAEGSEQALRAMIATVLSFPAYQLQ
ncbi:DUF1800 family protein [sulfur-oxidizing endosymbiont of Gigantopelta aegis]|uniref:DUF1800 family protein n=1 Tax=sulfur-oxidizing endosymbiont of Gigantopelta aegis TaxID=2794934 RepID=UPI001BE4A03F|nr:DUF1800 family protein [sulfur-oxidizing endosymbiont of Gigantopelta aegis]